MEPAIFFQGDEEGWRRGFTSSRVTWRYSTLPDADAFLSLFIYSPFSLSFTSRGRDLFTCTETFNFAQRDGHWISPTNRIIRANFLPFSLPVSPRRGSLRPSLHPSLSLSLSLFPRVHFRFDGENRSIKWLLIISAVLKSDDFFLRRNGRSLLLFISILGLFGDF